MSRAILLGVTHDSFWTGPVTVNHRPASRFTVATYVERGVCGIDRQRIPIDRERDRRIGDGSR